MRLSETLIYLYQASALLLTVASAVCKVLLSLPYAIWCCLLANCTATAKCDPYQTQCVYYEGKVFHKRRRPVENTFEYPVRMAVVDLEHLPAWWDATTADNLTAHAARVFAGTDGAVKLLTHPPSARYTQNPLSVYYCYSKDNQLQVCIGELTNTPWGERVTFLFRPEGERLVKALHVSPFMDMDNTWQLKTSDPSKGDKLVISIMVSHPVHGQFFDALLTATRNCTPSQAPNECTNFATLWRYGYQPHRVALWIYWQAVKLLWKGVPFVDKPSVSYRQKVDLVAKNPVSRAGSHFVWREALTWPWNVHL